ncbi:uncharacterized protein EV154DRAFT_529462 [Mucor mucedo]|uniref:uncharacterized protein n=1 Tax=Mucor mucedo TaxID=29922 RepID=UPI00221F4E39|nr:uncharacterized protein EV154DRAFT_529462 [Mucor mucedo]KAI7871943.1 hypothetical protein EV154DRAFT_529462 [Mucor mucedo]
MPHSRSKIDMPGHHAIIIGYYSVIKDASCLCSRSYNILESVLGGFIAAKKQGVFEDEDKLLEIKQYSLNLYADFKAIKQRNFNATSSIVALEKELSFELQATQNTIKGLSGGIMQLTNRNKYGKMKLLLNDLERLFQHMSFLLLELDRIDKAVEGVMDDIQEYTVLTENSARYSSSKGDRVKIIADKMLLGTQTLQHHLKHMEAGANKTALQFRHNFFHILLA